MELRAENIHFSYGDKLTVKGCSLTLAPGEFTIITGPNGSGKSTLLHLLGGLLAPDSGSITLDGRALNSFNHLQRACQVGVLMQEKQPALDFTVRERVAMGRFAALPRFFAPDSAEQKRIAGVLEKMEMLPFADTPCNQLSGGEYQKVLIASLLVRNTPVMLLDEPTSALDPAGALKIMNLLREIKKDTAIALVTHDLALAAAFADRLCLIRCGEICVSGPPGEVLTRENINQVYHCDSEILGSSAGVVPVFR